MSSATVAGITKARFASQWDTALAAVKEPNATFDPAGKQWVQLRFPGSREERADIGEPDAPLAEETGSIMVDVFVPANAGDDLARIIADAIWAIFRFQNIEGVRYDERMAGQSGWREPDGVGGVWWGLSYGISYRYMSV